MARRKRDWPQNEKDTNRHGLKRYIPAEVALAVRQRCGFGCVRCGAALVDYDHFEPEFANAKRHDAAGIILLCRACHGEKNSGFLSKATIRDCLKDPLAIRRGFSAAGFDVGKSWPEIQLGPVSVRLGYVILECNGHEVLRIDEPEALGAPFRLNATFRDHDGEVTLQIIDNIWRVRTGNWDAVQEGPRIYIRRGPRDIVLVLHTLPPDKLVIERLNMRTEDYKIVLDGTVLHATTPSGRVDTLHDVRVSGGYNAVSVGPAGIGLNTDGKRADFPSPAIGRDSKQEPPRRPPPYTGGGAVRIGSMTIGGAHIRNFGVYGAGIRASADGGVEVGWTPDEEKK
jgi:hypothetical protein